MVFRRLIAASLALTLALPAPLADQSIGYNGDLYSNRGRQFYASISKRF